MTFVRRGKKHERVRARALERESKLDDIVRYARFAVQRSSTCLQTCVIVERMMAKLLPEERFTMRLGSLHVLSTTGRRKDDTLFDPRSPEGIDGGFHAWLEDPSGDLLDPSIAITLASHDVDIDPVLMIRGKTRDFQRSGLRFCYEEVPELELLNLEENEAYIELTVAIALAGRFPQGGGTRFCTLDVGWRTAPSL